MRRKTCSRGWIVRYYARAYGARNDPDTRPVAPAGGSAGRTEAWLRERLPAGDRRLDLRNRWVAQFQAASNLTSGALWPGLSRGRRPPFGRRHRDMARAIGAVGGILSFRWRRVCALCRIRRHRSGYRDGRRHGMSRDGRCRSGTSRTSGGLAASRSSTRWPTCTPSTSRPPDWHISANLQALSNDRCAGGLIGGTDRRPLRCPTWRRSRIG